jgi:hypothetical protein
MAEDADDDEAGYTLDAESFLKVRRVCDDFDRSPVNQRRSLGTGNRTGYRQVPGIQFYNDSSETAPGGACMRVTGFTDGRKINNGTLGDGQPIIKIGKPDTTFGIYVVNDMVDIDSHAFGTCYEMGDAPFAYDSGTPDLLDGYGPKPDQWTWSKGYPGLMLCYGNWRTTDKIAYGSLSPTVGLIGKDNGSGITARSGTTPGTGTVLVYANVANVLTDTTMTVTCLNLSASAVTASAYIQAKFASGY